MRPCIISCAVNDGRFPYEKLLQDQRDSQRRLCPEIARLDWMGCLPHGAKPHAQSKYGFKVHAFEQAFRRKYDVVLWLDSSVALLRHPKVLFDIISDSGYFLMKRDQKLASEIRPDLGATVLSHWNMCRGQAIGFKHGHRTGMMLYRQWAELEANGWFNEGDLGYHRHDEACLALLLQQSGLPFSQPTGQPIFENYWQHHTPPP
jgi:hypothetical protein